MIAAADLPGRDLGFTSDGEWAAGLVERFPLSWAGKLLDAWRASPKQRAARNLQHLATCRTIQRAEAAGLPADAGDSTIREEAEKSARDMVRRLGRITRHAAAMVAPRCVKRPDHLERMELLGQVMEAQHWLASRGLGEEWPAGRDITIRGALRRVCAPEWWRRVLRKLHARAVEGTARAIGMVSKTAGCYASDEACKRRRGQVARNAAALANVLAINEHGQEYTLAELAAKGPADKAIRRHELMTRIAGFELIARDCGHEALFITVTCPSRMHAMRTVPGQAWRVEENPAHDGTRPDAAQGYLAKVWGRFRAAAARWGVELYGFRIAEPNHDGTPHWHAILFMPAAVQPGTVKSNPHQGKPAAAFCESLLRRYFLADSPDERGADKHRVKVETIDWTKGSAAGYVAKYVAKNIDGMHVEKDLYGNEAMHSSQRVEAWASTWRVRQFQQIGGAPVGIWRELRRVHTDQAQAAPAVALMLDAVNVAKDAGQHHSEAVQRHTAAHGWASYLELQGGPRVPRKLLRVRLLKEQSGELGRYGEVTAPRAVGVVTVDTVREFVPMALLPEGGFWRVARRTVEVESERADWIVEPRGAADAVRGRIAAGAARRPWSPVNNCTRRHPGGDAQEGARMFAPLHIRHRKLGRWNTWSTDDGIERSEHRPGPGQ